MRLIVCASLFVIASAVLCGCTASTMANEADDSEPVGDAASSSQAKAAVIETPVEEETAMSTDTIPEGFQDLPVNADGKVVLSEEEWKKRLTPDQFHVCRKHGTEPSFRNEYWDNKDDGLYRCRACGQSLFASDTKYKSGTGWPSFWQPISEDAVETQTDRKFFMVRTEVHCSRCESHLGHVFEDGPQPTGLRYCMNSAAMLFEESADSADAGGEAAPE